MAIGRLIAKSLLDGVSVGIRGFGTFEHRAPAAQQHVHENHHIWTSPRPEIVFHANPAAGFDSSGASSSSQEGRLLAELLQADGGLTAEDAARMSAAWAADVRRELEDSGISVLRGLGTFTLSEGSVLFKQDDDFPSTSDLPAIEGYSAKRVGAPPIIPTPPTDVPAPEGSALEVPAPEASALEVPAPEASGPDDVSEESGDDIPDFEDAEVDQDSEEVDGSDDAEESLEEAFHEAASHDDATKDESEELEAEPEDLTEPDSEQEAELDDAAPATDDEVDVTDEEEVDEPLPIVPPPARSRTPRRYERNQGGSSKAAVWVLAVVALVVVVALVYRFALNPATQEPAIAEQQSEQEASAGDDSTGVALDDSTAIAAVPGTDDPAGQGDTDAGDDAQTSTEDPASAAQEPPAASTDELVRGMGGYTLVVGSTLNEGTARQALSQYERLGLPMGVLAYETDDVTRYRIAVGRYETAALADTARVQRADELPEGTWVLAIR